MKRFVHGEGFERVGDDDGQGKRLFDMIEMPFREEFSELFIRGINGKGNVQESV